MKGLKLPVVIVIVAFVLSVTISGRGRRYR